MQKMSGEYCFIVMPTLNAAAAGVVLEHAIEIAGYPCGGVLVRDYMRRGGVKPGNMAIMAASWGSDCRYIGYLNDDVQIEQNGWLATLIDVLEVDRSIAVVAPGGPCRSGLQSQGRPGMEHGVHIVTQPLAWFCAVIRAEAFNQVGTFDEGYTHYADETDWERRAWLLGWKSAYVQHVYVYHKCSDRIEPWWTQDTTRYRQKWEGT